MTKPNFKNKTEHANWRVRIPSAGAFYWCLLIVCSLLIVHALLQYKNPENKVPTVKISELSAAIKSGDLSPSVETVLEAILNDWMDLQYGVMTAYTTGQTVIPMECTIADIKEAIKDETVDKKFKDIFKKIWETYKSGNLSIQSKWTNTSGWDPNLKPVLVFVTPDKESFNYYPERTLDTY